MRNASRPFKTAFSTNEWVDEIRAAFSFLTRLPVSNHAPLPDDVFGRAMGWHPLVGAVIGLCGAVVFWIAAGFRLPDVVAALLALGTTILITGGLHEDGLADFADGVGGGRTPAEKLEKMRDSRIGAFGALALLFSIGLRIGALAAMSSAFAAGMSLIGAAAASRVAPVALARWLPPARPDGLGAKHGAPPLLRVAMAGGLGFVFAQFFIGPGAIPILLIAGGAVYALGRLALREIGGQTGDVLGAGQQVAEIAMLIVLAAVFR